MTLEATITELCSKTRQAAKPLARAGSETRTNILHTLANVIESGRHEILVAFCVNGHDTCQLAPRLPPHLPL